MNINKLYFCPDCNKYLEWKDCLLVDCHKIMHNHSPNLSKFMYPECNVSTCSFIKSLFPSGVEDAGRTIVLETNIDLAHFLSHCYYPSLYTYSKSFHPYDVEGKEITSDKEASPAPPTYKHIICIGDEIYTSKSSVSWASETSCNKLAQEMIKRGKTIIPMCPECKSILAEDKILVGQCLSLLALHIARSWTMINYNRTKLISHTNPANRLISYVKKGIKKNRLLTILAHTIIFNNYVCTKEMIKYVEENKIKLNFKEKTVKEMILSMLNDLSLDRTYFFYATEVDTESVKEILNWIMKIKKHDVISGILDKKNIKFSKALADSTDPEHPQYPQILAEYFKLV